MFYFVHCIYKLVGSRVIHLFTSEEKKQKVEGHRLELWILTSQDAIIRVYLKGNDVLFCSLRLQVGQIMSYTIQPGIYSPVKKKNK